MYYVQTGDTEKALRTVNGQVISADPDLAARGTGVEIRLPVADKVASKKDKGIVETMQEVVLGNATTGKQGLIPVNIFRAMVQMDILPLIFFSLLLGAALTVVGGHAKIAINTISALNDGVMKIVHWITVSYTHLTLPTILRV